MGRTHAKIIHDYIKESKEVGEIRSRTRNARAAYYNQAALVAGYEQLIRNVGTVGVKPHE